MHRTHEGLVGPDTIELVATPHAPGAWITENVATKPEFRRRGLVDKLLAEMMERGRRRGATVADISVFIGNDPAQRAYEKCGFAVIAERHDREFESVYGTPGTRTLRRSL
ncbi:MAG: GNAT family N-acetyltransferase [Chloroflexi bacterium]|nr:GNAT family N-acetyltransferase [Chloroflexota bacterium]